MMYARKLKRKCSVRGCRNIDTYTISLTREAGNSVIICKSCLEDGVEAVKNYTGIIPKPKEGEAPKLFFNEKAFGKKEEKRGNEPTQLQKVPPIVEDKPGEDNKDIVIDGENETMGVKKKAVKKKG